MVTKRGGRTVVSDKIHSERDHAACGPCLEKSQPLWAGQPRVLLQEFESPRRNLSPPGVNTVWYGAVYHPACAFIASHSHVVQREPAISRCVVVMTFIHPISPFKCTTYILTFICLLEINFVRVVVNRSYNVPSELAGLLFIRLMSKG